MRVKSQWFRGAGTRSAAEQAGVMAFIAWRVAEAMVKRLRKGGYDIDTGPAWFGVMREVLIFLVQVTDRMAAAGLDAEERVVFTTALVRRLAALVEESETEWLGAPPGGSPGWAESFIDQCNVVGAHYGDFGGTLRPSCDDGALLFDPDYAFVRYLGSRVEAFVQGQARHWVVDQITAVEVPEAVDALQRGMRGLYDPPRTHARRAGMSGD